MQPKPTNNDGVTIIVPVYNEAEGLVDFATELEAALEGFTCPYEVLFVDDGSSDDTQSILNEHSLPHIRHDVNLGYGAAIKAGIQSTTLSNIVIIDADGTYPADQILSLAAKLDHADMAVGARTGADAKVPLIRRPAKWVIRLFAEWMVRKSVPDLNSGLRAFRRDCVAPIIRLLPDGFSLTTTMTIALMATGAKVEYIQTDYRKRIGQSKFRPIVDTWNLILVILRTIVLLRPLNFFLPLSVVLAAAAVLIGGVSLWLGEFMDATFIVLMMASMQMFVLGLIADLIVRVQYRTH